MYMNTHMHMCTCTYVYAYAYTYMHAHAKIIKIYIYITCVHIYHIYDVHVYTRAYECILYVYTNANMHMCELRASIVNMPSK